MSAAPLPPPAPTRGLPPAPRAPALSLAPSLALSLALGACSAPAAPPLSAAIRRPIAEERVVFWRADLASLARELPRRHVAPFRVIARADFEARVAALDARIPALADDEVVVELAGIAAALGDGHTGLHLWDGRLGLPRLPVAFERLADGVFLTAALPPHLDALQHELVRVGGVEVEEALRRVARYVPHDNAAGLSLLAPRCLSIGPALSAAGLAPDPEHALFTVRDAQGAERELACAAVPDASSATWAVLRAPDAETPLYQRALGPCYGFERLADGRALVLQYRRCAHDPEEHFGDFCRRFFAAVDADPPERLIVDLRGNPGGNSAVSRPLLEGLKARRWLDRPGRIYVLIDRGTFSSGLWAALDLEADTHALLVGEPTGGRPNAPGEVRSFELLRSDIRVVYATRLWRRGGERQDGESLFPDVPAAPTSDDRYHGHDPALAAALSHEPAPGADDGGGR